jgi:hypothetical protein
MVSFSYHRNFTRFQYLFIHFPLHVSVIVSFHNSSMFHLGFDISLLWFITLSFAYFYYLFTSVSLS